jgi:hypothetical protein
MSNFTTFFPSAGGASGGGGGISTNPKDLHRRIVSYLKLYTNNDDATGIVGNYLSTFWTNGKWTLGSVTNCDFPRSSIIIPQVIDTWHTVKDLTTTNGGLLFNIIPLIHYTAAQICQVRITIDGVESVITYGDGVSPAIAGTLVLGGTHMGRPPGSSTTYSNAQTWERIGNPKQYGYKYASDTNSYGNGGLALHYNSNSVTIPDDSLLFNHIGFNETLKIEVKTNMVRSDGGFPYAGCTVMTFDY